MISQSGYNLQRLLFCFVFFSILVLFSSSPPSSGGSCTSRSGRRSRLLPGAKITIMVCCWCWCWPRVFTEEIPKCPKNKFPHFVAGKIPTWKRAKVCFIMWKWFLVESLNLIHTNMTPIMIAARETCPITRQRQNKIAVWPISLPFCPSVPFPRWWVQKIENSENSEKYSDVWETSTVSNRPTVGSNWVCQRSSSRIWEFRTLPSTPRSYIWVRPAGETRSNAT